MWQYDKTKALNVAELVQKRTCLNSGISVFKVQLNLPPQQRSRSHFQKACNYIFTGRSCLKCFCQEMFGSQEFLQKRCLQCLANMGHIFLKVFLRYDNSAETTDSLEKIRICWPFHFFSVICFSYEIKLSYFKSFENLFAGTYAVVLIWQ